MLICTDMERFLHEVTWCENSHQNRTRGETPGLLCCVQMALSPFTYSHAELIELK